MKTKASAEILRRFSNLPASAAGDSVASVRRSKWHTSGIEVLEAASFVLSQLKSATQQKEIKEITSAAAAYAAKAQLAEEENCDVEHEALWELLAESGHDPPAASAASIRQPPEQTGSASPTQPDPGESRCGHRLRERVNLS